MQSNNMSSLGLNELSLLSSSLVSVDLSYNNITAVSDGAINDVPKLAVLNIDHSPTTCTIVPQSATDVARLNCSCATGFATDSFRPAFCSLLRTTKRFFV
jgi:hypothetical protein